MSYSRDSRIHNRVHFTFFTLYLGKISSAERFLRFILGLNFMKKKINVQKVKGRLGASFQTGDFKHRVKDIFRTEYN
jgi:hypothetical protein